MKVAHLLPAMEQGGVETVVSDLVRILTDGGWESVVISSGGRLVRRIEENGGRHRTADLKSKNPLTCLSRILALRRILGEERPDLVCVHSRVPAWLYVGVRKLDAIAARFRSRPAARVPWISYAHGANSVSRYSEVMTRGDLVVTPSRFLADYLKLNYGTEEGKIRVVPNAVDANRFDPDRLDREFIAVKRREWGLADGDHVLMALGRITPVKGLDALIRDFAEERKTQPNLKLVIVGGADRHHLKYLSSLKSLASSLIPHPSSLPIIFAGPQTKIPECLSIADEVVSANTTKPESFGLSIVEAYAMNKPVRARHFGGAAEVMDAVAKVSAPSLREAAVGLYGLDRFAERTLSVYRELMERNR